MGETDTEIPVGSDEATDAKPKPVVKDDLAYLIVAAGLAAYAESGDIRGLVVAVIVYAIGYFGLRINGQIQDRKRAENGN